MNAGALTWRAVSGGAVAHQRGRLALAIAAVALGVGLGYAVALVNATAVDEFGSALRTLAGTADVEIRGPRGGFDEAIFATVAGDPDVAVASPVVEVDARLAGRDEALRIYGIDAFRAAAVTPALIGSGGDALDLLRPGRVFLSPAAARALDVSPGGTIAVQAGMANVPLVVAGLLPEELTQRAATMDIGAAQDLFARGGRLSRIDVRLQPGVAVAAVESRLAAVLPAGVTVASPAANADSALRMSRAYRVNLDVLALVALFTGALLVFATQTLSVARRRAQLALLRALGITRGELTSRLVLEGALLGLVGGVAGLGVGHALAAGVLRFVGADLGAGYFRGVAPALRVDPWTAAAFALLGAAVCALASLLPARRTARAAPAAALKAGPASDDMQRAPSARGASILLLTGGAMTLLPPLEGLPLFGYAAMAALLAGTLLLLPWLAQHVLALLPRVTRPAPALALARLRAAPGEAGVSLAAIVASVSLMVSMAIMVASFRESLTTWLHQVLPADVYVRAGAAGDSVFLSPAIQQRMQAVPGVAGIAFARSNVVSVAPAAPRVTVLARDLPAGDPARALVLVSTPHALPDGEVPLWASESVADALGWRSGSRVTLPLGGARQAFTVAGIFRDYARQQGAIVIERDRYAALTGDATATEAAVQLDRGTTPAAFEQALAKAMPEAAHMSFATPGELRDISLRIFDRTFAVTWVLLAVAIAIGLAGLSSAFGASIVARRREFGMLRHIGMTRSQIAAMLVTEGTVMTAVGLVAGLALGVALAFVLVHVVNRQSFHWSMDIALPYGVLACLVAGLLAAAAVTSLASARQALRQDAIAAVKDDW